MFLDPQKREMPCNGQVLELLGWPRLVFLVVLDLQKNMLFFNDQARLRMRLHESERIIRLRESDFSSSESHCTSHNSRIHGKSSRVCVGPFSCAAAGFSASASVLGARSTCRALPASVAPCMSQDDSPMHDARNSRGAGGLLPVSKSTSYNLEGS